jgi:hypothetical protein
MVAWWVWLTVGAWFALSVVGGEVWGELTGGGLRELLPLFTVPASGYGEILRDLVLAPFWLLWWLCAEFVFSPLVLLLWLIVAALGLIVSGLQVLHRTTRR